MLLLMEPMSKQDKEIQRSANEPAPRFYRLCTPPLDTKDPLYQEIFELIDKTFGVPSNYVKCAMYDYKDRPDVLINFWVPDPNQDELALIRQNVILSYRYEKGKVEHT